MYRTDSEKRGEIIVCFNNNNCSCLIILLIILLLFCNNGCGCGGNVAGSSDNSCGCC